MFQGTPQYIPLAGTDWWRITMSYVAIGPQVVTSGTQSAILDTGTTLLIGPTSAVDSVSWALDNSHLRFFRTLFLS